MEINQAGDVERRGLGDKSMYGVSKQGAGSVTACCDALVVAVVFCLGTTSHFEKEGWIVTLGWILLTPLCVHWPCSVGIFEMK